MLPSGIPNKEGEKTKKKTNKQRIEEDDWMFDNPPISKAKIGKKLRTKASIYKDSKEDKIARTDLPSLT